LSASGRKQEFLAWQENTIGAKMWYFIATNLETACANRAEDALELTARVSSYNPMSTITITLNLLSRS